MRRYPTLSGVEGCSVVFFFKVKKTKLKSQASGDRPHKNFVSFRIEAQGKSRTFCGSEDSQKDDPIFQGLSDTEARVGKSRWRGLYCAWNPRCRKQEIFMQPCIAVGKPMAADGLFGTFSSRKKYNGYGNMITDLNKNLTVTRYNYLNLPEQIEIAMNGLNHIHYLYDAAGTKLARQTVEEGTPYEEITTDYCGSFVYENDVLFHLLTADQVQSKQKAQFRPNFTPKTMDVIIR